METRDQELAVRTCRPVWSCGSGNLRTVVTALTMLLATLMSAEAQDATDHAVHANIVYHFVKYVDWPEDRKTGEFVIGIVGDATLVEDFQNEIANKSVGEQAIVVRRYSPLQAEYDCHILFVGENYSGSLRKIARRTAGTPVLLVSEERGMISRGACINFIIEADRLKLEINKTHIEQRRLNIASELLQLGRLVR